MKALTLTQPWATLMAIGAKRIETRSWYTRYRGPLAVHAAKGYPAWAKALYLENPFYQSLLEIGGIYGVPSSPAVEDIRDHLKEVRGHVLAVGELVECLPTEATGCLPGVFDDYPQLDTLTEEDFGDFSPGRFGWVIENVQLLKYPVAAKGSLGLWEWNEPTGVLLSANVSNPQSITTEKESAKS